MTILRLVFNLIVFLIPAALAGRVAARLARTSRDHWKLLAWLPVLPLTGWGVIIAWSVTRDPTSHNLWPFELVYWSALSLLLFGAFHLARRVAMRRDGTS